jgi:hypothetical protein
VAPACFSGWAEIGREEGLLWSMALNVLRKSPGIGDFCVV